LKEIDSPSRCYCGHLDQWHFAGTCKWCDKMSKRYTSFNFRPHHQFELDTPEIRLKHDKEVAEEFEKAYGQHLLIKPGTVQL